MKECYSTILMQFKLIPSNWYQHYMHYVPWFSLSSWEGINLTSALVLASFTVTKIPLHHSTLYKVLEENEVLWSTFFPKNLDRETRLNCCNHRIQCLTCMLINVGRFLLLFYAEHYLFPVPNFSSSCPWKLWSWWHSWAEAGASAVYQDTVQFWSLQKFPSTAMESIHQLHDIT